MKEKIIRVEDQECWHQFKILCISESIGLSKKIEQLIADYVKKQGGLKDGEIKRGKRSKDMD